MKTLSREGIQRMIDGQGASSGGGGGIQSLAGYATQVWTEENYLSKPYFNQLFTVHTQTTTTVVDDQGEPVGEPAIDYGTLAPNTLPGTTETTDEETGYVTTVATVITSIEAKFGFWSQSFISALGQGSGGGGGGASALTDLVDVAISSVENGQVLMYDSTLSKWVNGTVQSGGATALTTLTDVAISSVKNDQVLTYNSTSGKWVNGGANYMSRESTENAYDTTPGQKIITVSNDNTIVSDGKWGSLIQWGNSNKTPGTADDATWYNQLIGMTNDRLYFRTRTNGGNWTTTKKIAFTSDFSSWALAATKPSYAFSELTSHPTTLSGYGITDAKIESGVITLGGNSITPLTSESDPTVPAWAKAATKPSYSFSEITNKPTTLSGYGITDAYTKTEADGKFLTIAFFRSLFKAYTSANAEVVPNSGDTSTIASIKAMFGFWTEQYISALGQGSGGGGGGASALTDLVDVAISNPTDGQVLKYNATTGIWYNGTVQSGSSAWADITGKPTTLSGYGITDAYTKTEADAKYLTSSSFSDFSASSLNISATIGTTTRTVQAPTIAYLGNNDEAASSETIPSSKFAGTKFGASRGFYMTGVYRSESSPTDIPCNYGNILNILGGGGGQLLAEWCGTYKTGHLYYRSHRDYLTTGGWTPWEKIAFISDFSSWALASTKPSYTFSELTSHPTTLSGYGITDAYINSGTIYLGGNSITPLTSFTETDPTVPAWAKASTKPSYAFSELTSHPTTLSGYGITDAYTKTEADGKFLTIAFFRSLFKAYTSANAEVVPNSGDTTTIASIKAMFGFWTQQYISALGQNSSGGGGGASALTDLVDVAISSVENGQVLMYDSTLNKWVNGTVQSGGATTLTALTDVAISSVQNDQVLTYNSTSGKWVNGGANYMSRESTENAYDTTKGLKIITISNDTTLIGKTAWGSLIQWGSSNETPGTADDRTWYNQLIGLTNDRLYFRTRTNGGDWTTVKKIAFISDFSSWALASTKPSYAFSELTSHPTTLSGYGITDAYINSGTIYLGGNSITPLTSFTETDPTVPAWAKASTKPSYSFSELTSHPTTLSGYGITDAYINSGTIYLGSNSITPLTASDHPSRSYTFTVNTEYTAKWHRLGNYKTAGNASNFAIMLYTGSGYNANASQNSFARIVVKDGWQQTAAATNSVGVTLERFGNFDSSHEIKAVVVATSDREGALWVYLPWQYADGNYTISGVYDTWTHNSGYTDDTTTDPTSNQRDTGYFDIVYNKTYPQFSNLRLRNGTDNYGSYLYFGDGSNAFICEPTDDSLQYKVGANKAHVFTVGNSNKAEVNSSGLTVNGSLSITGFIDGATNIELKPSTNSAGNGGYIDFHYNQSSSDYTSRIIEDASGRLYLVASNGIRIGDCVITWDTTNNAMKVQKADGTAANFYATGGVSALGMSAGTSSVSSMTFNYLKVNNELTLPSDIIAGTGAFIVKNRNDGSGLLLFNSYENSKITSHSYDYNQYDNVGLHGTNYNYDETWWIDPDGCAKFNRLYLDGSRYLYVSNGTLYYFNGSSSRAILLTD